MSKRFSFYRRLDILSRIYILNYLDITLLDSDNCILALTTAKRVIKPRATEYTELTDVRLILASLSMSKVNLIFRWVYLSLLCGDKQVKMNGKLLSILSKYLSNTEMDYVINDSAPTYLSGKSLISEHNIADIIDHLKWDYFKKMDGNLKARIKQRFKPKSLNMNLAELIEDIGIDNRVELTVQKFLPALKEVINNYSKTN